MKNRLRKIILIAGLLFGVLGFSQTEPALTSLLDAVKFRKATTAIRNQYVVPSGEIWLIGNEDTDVLEWWDGAAWVDLASSGADGVISNVALNVESLDFTGSSGGFNSSVDLSSFALDADFSNYVDLTSNQTITGTKGFTGAGVANSSSDVTSLTNDAINAPSLLRFTSRTPTDISVSSRLGLYINDLDQRLFGFDNAPSGFVTDTPTFWMNLSTGDMNITGNYLINGVATAGTDDQTLAEVLAEGNTANNDILPDVTLSRNLGSGTFRWGSLNVNSVDINSSAIFNPTDTEPSALEGRLYFDDSENRFKSHDGTSFRPLAYQDEASGSSYNAPTINSLNGLADFTTTDTNIHSSASKVYNQLSAAETIEIELANANVSEVDVYNFDLNNASGQIDFTSTNGFVANGFTGNAVRLDGIGSVDFTETGVDTGVFKVFAGDNVSYVTIDNTAPSVPTSLTNDAQGGTTLDYSWTASTDNISVTGYEYELDDSGTPISIGNVTSYQVTSLSNSTSYDFKVRAYDAAGNRSAYTSNVSGTTTAGVTNLFSEANITNADNYTAATYGSWTDGGSGTFGFTESTDDPALNCLTSINYSRDQTSGTTFRNAKLPLDATTITGYSDATTYTVTIYVKTSSASDDLRFNVTNQDVLTSSSGSVSGDLIDLTVSDTNWNQYTFDFSGDGGGTVLEVFGAYAQAVDFDIYFTEIVIE